MWRGMDGCRSAHGAYRWEDRWISCRAMPASSVEAIVYLLRVLAIVLRALHMSVS